MSSCEAVISCASGGLGGCGGRLCAACRTLLKKYELLRYPAAKDGSPDTSQQPERHQLCGFTASIGRKSASADGRLEIPGRTGGGADGLRMTIASASCEPRKGDRVMVDGAEYRITVMHGGGLNVAVLVRV